MLSRDTIKTCESLRYSGYSDSNSSAVYFLTFFFVFFWDRTMDKRDEKKTRS